MCVIVRDLIVYGVLTDMMRGRPAVYATFSSYDEVAHHSGLERADTLEALRKLDQQFGRIDRARRYAPRPYEIVVLSDHGQTQGATFKQRNGYGLDELVERSLEHGTVKEVAGGDEQHVDGRASRSARRPGRTQKQEKRSKKDVSDRQVVVLGSGNLGLISLMEEPRRLTLEEIDERHPRLIPALREHPHVGWLLVRSSERGPRRARRRTAPTTSPRARVEGEDPLAPFSPNAPRHLLRTDGFPHVADIMVGSFYDPDLEEGCAFEELISFHGGLGGPQTRPFILHPAELAGPGRADRRRGAGARRARPAGGGCCRAATAPAHAPLDEHRLGGARHRRNDRRSPSTAMLLVRRRAPEGSCFADGDRAVRRLRRARDRLLRAARVRRLPRLRELRPVASRGGGRGASCWPSRSRRPSSSAPGCRASSPASWSATAARSCTSEWPRAEAGTLGRRDQPVGRRAVPDAARRSSRGRRAEQAAYGKWLDQTSDREAARIDRIHGAVGVIPTPLWIVLFFISVVIFVFMLFFADSGEGAVTQARPDGLGRVGDRRDAAADPASSTARSTSGVGGVRPVAMERTLRIIDEELQAVGPRSPLPCDAEGNPVCADRAQCRAVSPRRARRSLRRASPGRRRPRPGAD